MMIIDNQYEITQRVYLLTDRDQSPRIITAIISRQCGIMYELSCGMSTSNHYEFELSAEENVLIKTTS